MSNVVVMRQTTGPDIVGIFVGVKSKEDGLSTQISTFVIEHPYIPMVDHSSGNFRLVPYFPLSSQTLFDFQVKNIQVMAPATEELSTEYINGIARLNKISSMDSEEIAEQKRNFEKALQELQISPTTNTIQ